MVKPDEIKVKNYEKQIHSKLKECEMKKKDRLIKTIVFLNVVIGIWT